MSFFLRVDPRRARHPKWSVLSDAAYRFADELLLWGAEHETNFIPKATLARMAGTGKLPKDWRKL